MGKIVFDLLVVAVIFSAIIYTISWKLFFKIGKKADKITKQIQEEMDRED